MKELPLTLSVMLLVAPAIAQDAQQDAKATENKVEAYLRENPRIARNIQAQNIAKENLQWMFALGGAAPEETDQARAERAMKAALKVMTDGDKLKDKQAEELYEIVFPKGIDWDAKYETYLKENPGVARAVESGKITREKVMAGIKSRAGEKAPTEEEQLEALYQKLLREDRTLGRTPKADLMPRLKAMLERGEGKSLRPETTTRQRSMTFGLYFNELIESGQVERFDKDLKRCTTSGLRRLAVKVDRRNEVKQQIGLAAGGAEVRLVSRANRERGDHGNNRAARSSGKNVPGEN